MLGGSVEDRCPRSQFTASRKLPGPVANGTHERILGTIAPLKMRTKGNLCFVPVTLLNPKSGAHIQIRALLDSVCGRDLISLILVLGIGLAIKCLKERQTFE